MEDRHREELLAWLALTRVPRFGAGRLQRLLRQYPEPAAIFQADRAALLELGLTESTVSKLQKPDRKAARADLDWLAASGCRLISWHHPGYPSLLKEIPDPPPALFVRGEPEVLSTLMVAVVGSRNPTPPGRRAAREMAESLAESGITVVSGMATGIDTQAHEGALAARAPTVAVLGNGLKSVYPARNRRLAERIAAGGALVSEFPPEAPPLAAHFPRRNRIISGLAAGVVVVEAAVRSGSLITARCGMEQGREVFAVPGSIHNPMARGCHALIKDGAKLTETVADILEELGALSLAACVDRKPSDFQQHKGAALDAAAKLLLDNISDAPIGIDELIDLTLMSVDEISAKLLDLELRGLIESIAGGAYIRRE